MDQNSTTSPDQRKPHRAGRVGPGLGLRFWAGLLNLSRAGGAFARCGKAVSVTSRYDKDVILKRLRRRRLQRQGWGASDRFLNLYLWVFVFLALALVLFVGVWLFL